MRKSNYSNRNEISYKRIVSYTVICEIYTDAFDITFYATNNIPPPNENEERLITGQKRINRKLKAESIKPITKLNTDILQPINLARHEAARGSVNVSKENLKEKMSTLIQMVKIIFLYLLID